MVLSSEYIVRFCFLNGRARLLPILSVPINVLARGLEGSGRREPPPPEVGTVVV